MSEQWQKPIPPDSSDRDRMENALLHLGRIIGAALLLQKRLGGDPPELLLEIIAAAKRAATWLGATLWEETAGESSDPFGEG